MSDRHAPIDGEISRANALRAVRAGGIAQREGKQVSDCPWSSNAPEDRFLRHFWVRGFVSSRENL